MKKCEEYSVMLGSYADDELSPEDSDDVKRHLSVCLDCAQSLEMLRKTDDIARSSGVEHVSDAEWARCWEAIEAAIDAESTSTTGVERVPSRGRRRHRVWRFSDYWKPLVGLAAAAAILLGVALHFALVEDKDSEANQPVLASGGFFDSLKTDSPNHTIIFSPPTENDVAVIWLINNASIEEDATRNGT